MCTIELCRKEGLPLEEFVEIKVCQTKCELPKTPDNKITKENDGGKK